MQHTPTPEPRIRLAGASDRLVDVGPDDRWLVVVAHPDDETFGCGSLVAHAARHGARVCVLCATRGEAGEPTMLVPADADLGAVRERELRSAAALLGAERVELLDHRDSGFDGPLHQRSLCAATQETIVAEITDRLIEIAPTVVITLDGSDGHRDHERIRTCVRAAVAAIATNGTIELPDLYEQCLPNALMRRWLDEMRTTRPDTAYHTLDPNVLGRPDGDITHTVDVTAFLDVRQAAIAEHRSQTSPFDGLSDDLRRAFLCTDHLARVPFAS